jgi:hypothetical protein
LTQKALEGAAKKERDLDCEDSTGFGALVRIVEVAIEWEELHQDEIGSRRFVFNIMYGDRVEGRSGTCAMKCSSSSFLGGKGERRESSLGFSPYLFEYFTWFQF